MCVCGGGVGVGVNETGSEAMDTNAKFFLFEFGV